MQNDQRLPLADPGREHDAAEIFPLSQSPEEYAARNGHRWICFSFDNYRYRDPALNAWIQQLGDILFQRNGAPSITELRKRYLTLEECERLAEEEKEEI